MTAGVTIGQAAAFAGVTVKTVRHYHRLGLIGEPRRDASGYRRYGTADLLRLVQIRTLAAAGVPLAEVAAILDAGPDAGPDVGRDAGPDVGRDAGPDVGRDAGPGAGPDRFAAALADVERRLDERIDDLVARRDMLRRLVTGDRALLPAHVLEKLDRAAAAFGFTPEDVTMAREGLVLIRALVPEGFDDYVSRVERALADPRYVALIRRLWQAAAWEPDDPRVDELAAALAEHYLADPELLPVPAALRERADGAIRYGLLSRHGEDGKPAWTRLNALVEARLRAAGVELPPGK